MSRFNLGEPWDTELNAFCAAVIDIDRTKVVRAAVMAYITQFTAENEGVRLKYEHQRAKMMGVESGGKVTPIRSPAGTGK